MVALSHIAFGQKPTILSVDKSNASMNEIVTLHGNDFGYDPSNIKVFFGAAQASIQTISNQIMEVRTPAGATFANISITNITSGLTGYSPDPFFLNYQGEHGIVPDQCAYTTCNLWRSEWRRKARHCTF